MPTYEYKCDNCGHQFDVYQSMKDDKLTKCPNCAQYTLKRLIGTGGGLIFKGTGFYLTDYKNKPDENKSSNTSTELKKPEAVPSTNDNAITETKTTANSKQTEKKSSKAKSDKKKSDKE